MKKLIIVVAVLLLVLVAAPWGIGKIAESRVDRGVEQLVEVAPYLRIVERSYTPGWFRSEQEVTFEVVGPRSNDLGGGAAVDALNQIANAGVTVSPESGEAAAAATIVAPPPIDAMPPIPDKIELPTEAPSEPSPETLPPPVPAPLAEPPRFTIRNEILHGPVLWTSGFGVARVNTRIVVPETMRQSLIDTFGTDEPLRVSTRLGFFGGRRTTFAGDARKVVLKDGAGEISWEDLRVDVSYSSDLDRFGITGDWPRVEFHDSGDSNSIVAEKMTIDGESERIDGDLYDGDVEMRIGKVSIKEASGGYVAEDVYYLADSSLDGDFMSVAFGFGTGQIAGKSLSNLGATVEEMHYDFAVRRLHAKTLARLMTAIKESYTKPTVAGVSAEISALEPIKAQTFELFKHDPELIIERLGLSTPDGEAYFKGAVRFKGVTEEDLAIGGLGLIGKVDAEIQFNAHRKVVEKFPGGVSTLGELLDSGYVVREGDKLVSKIEFRGGALTINGKPQGIPGLGPPPPPQE
ncbi:MAG: DUF945 family protein [Steroidobacteraceae bacterium]|nr:DUF945 family protein [Steroidobacteraceae bacterium]